MRYGLFVRCLHEIHYMCVINPLHRFGWRYSRAFWERYKEILDISLPSFTSTPKIANPALSWNGRKELVDHMGTCNVCYKRIIVAESTDHPQRLRIFRKI